MIDYIENQIESMEKMGADSVSVIINLEHKNKNKKYLVHISIQEDDGSEVEEDGN